MSFISVQGWVHSMIYLTSNGHISSITQGKNPQKDIKSEQYNLQYILENEKDPPQVKSEAKLHFQVGKHSQRES